MYVLFVNPKSNYTLTTKHQILTSLQFQCFLNEDMEPKSASTFLCYTAST